VKSISAALGTDEWLRVRIGVGKPPLESGREVKAGGTDFLLSPMRKAELAVLDEMLDQAVRAVETILTKGVSVAMQEFNRKVEPEEK
jgi:PTH1 family peptidyl-tRNA hydrolase